MSVADEIKARLDIVAYIQQTVPLKKAGRTYKAPCPFHNERTPSFVVNPERQSWRCFGACAEGGDIFSFAMKQHGWSFREALENLGELAGVEVRQQTPQQREHTEKIDRLRGLVKLAADLYHKWLFDSNDPQAVAALNYARTKRGLSDETLQSFQIGFAPPGWSHLLDALTALGYSPDELVEAGVATRNEQGNTYDRFRNRLMIPIRDERGRTVGFGARALDPEERAKYLNSPQSQVFDKGRLLFGLDRAAQTIRNSETVVIVEGYLDVIQAHQAGYTDVVAQMGTALTETQLKLVAPRWANTIILALDSDAAGQTATRRSLEVARDVLQADYSGKLSIDMRVLAVPGAKDPDDLIRETPDAWPALVTAAIPVADYVIRQETAALPPNASLPQREAAARRVLPLLLASENDLYRQDNLQKLALKLRIGEDDLLRWANDQRQPPTSAAGPRIAEPPAPPPDLDDPPDLPPEAYGVGEDALFGDPPLHIVINERPETVLEAACLRGLLRRPERVYQVNRTFRELAGESLALADGPLRDLCADDFERDTIFHALMLMFERALGQDARAPLDYLRDQLDGQTVALIERLLAPTDDEQMRQQLGGGFPPDLQALLQRSARYAVDDQAGLQHQALRLRKARLERERRELIALQLEQPSEPSAPPNDPAGDQADVLPDYQSQIALSILATGLIDAELKRQGNATSVR
ncbi:MAG: DNA primase [Chloroflexi bacterium]|nr:DNA primase [Chloroflexota bacterium]